MPSLPGPKPSPSALKLASQVRADRINPSEPEPEVVSSPPSPPASLSVRAKATWNRLAPDLHRKGVLSPWDVDAFAAYCDLTVRVEDARELLAPGLLVRGRRDGVITNPAWRVYREALKLLGAYAGEFGLTPSARSRLRIGPPEA